VRGVVRRNEKGRLDEDDALVEKARVDAHSIREARPEDAPLLAAAERAIASVPGRLASRPDEIDDAAVRKKILDLDDPGRGVYLVAEHAGVVVGHAFLESLSLAATAHVFRVAIAVHEGHQRLGVGRALMNELLRWARSNPRAEKVELQVRSSNDRAIALYRSLGFVEEGRKTRRLKIGPKEYIDDVYMALWVGP
jgi:ribosomal protein S18 acetylase RimI-like enzyme